MKKSTKSVILIFVFLSLPFLTIYFTGIELTFSYCNYTNSSYVAKGIDPYQYPQDIFVTDNYAFIAHGYRGLLIYNTTAPEKRILIGNYSDGGRVRCVWINDNYAYLADRDDGLKILDITNKSNILKIGCYNNSLLNNFISDFYLLDNLVFLVDYYNGLQIINVSNPTSPTKISELYVSSSSRRLFVYNNLVFLSCGSDGLRIINITNPYLPTEISQYYIDGRIFSVSVTNNYVFAVNYDFGLEILDIGNITQPELLTTFPINGNTTGILLVNDTAFCSTSLSGLQIFNINNPISPQGLSQIAVNPQSITVEKNYLYIIPSYGVTEGDFKFRIFDITNIENPEEIIWEGFNNNPIIWVTFGVISSSLLVAFVFIIVNIIIKKKIRRNL